jgi:hypothetical protein
MALLSGGHPSHLIAQGTFFAVGASAAGGGFYAALGATGGILPIASAAVGTIVLAAACAWALVWYAYPAPGLLPSPRKQLNRRYVEIPVAGAALFGAVLGVGVLTSITTPLVWAGALAVLATGSAAAGALYGLGFALGRTLQLAQRRIYKPCFGGDIVRRIARRAPRYHAAGATVAACFIALAIAEHL